MLSHSILYALGDIVGADNLLTDARCLADFCCDKSTQFQANIGAVVYPQNTKQVRDLVLLANRKQLALVPSGGRTGLSGGAVATQGEVIVSLDKMNTIYRLDKVDQLIECQAGAITKQIQSLAENNGLFYPVDFASSGSSQIGGNISTNAGGINVIRYGMTRQWVKGLTVVTGKGDILQLNHGLEKNNTGFDLMALFIASEGSLGIITGVSLKLTQAPKPRQVALLAVDNFQHLSAILLQFKSTLSLNAFEFFDAKALKHVLARGHLKNPSLQPAAYYALIDYEIVNDEAVHQNLEACLEQGLCKDAIISQNEKQAKSLWRLREDISSTLAQFKPYKNDLSVRVSNVTDFLTQIEACIKAYYPDFEVVFYGHIGDGNLHLNILKPNTLSVSAFAEHCHTISFKIMHIVEQFNGSISAEHGVGLLKKDYLSFSKSAEEIAYMKAIKAVFDPNGVMNPGKIFD